MRKAERERAKHLELEGKEAIFKILCHGCPYRNLFGARSGIRSEVEEIPDAQAGSEPPDFLNTRRKGA
jgi:TPP-dependent indolepyruvate ferredoxin oxidoreductase alpha subunit